MIRHLVLLEWNDGVTDETIEAFTAALGRLPDAIAELRSHRYGPDLGIAGSTADFVICADFDTVEDFLVYRDHPAHQAFKAEHLLPHAQTRTAAQLDLG